MFYKGATTVKSNLTLLRKTAALTQQQLADACGVTRQTIIAIEKGNYVPSVLLSLKIAKELGCTVERIFTI